MLSRRGFLGAGLGAAAFVAGLVGTQGTRRPGAHVAPSEAEAATGTRRASAAKERWSRFTICIDPGHANRADGRQIRINPYTSSTRMRETGGTSGRLSGPEYKVNMQVAKLLAKYLRARGVKVVMTKTRHATTMSNKERAAVANRCKADLFIRLHCDSAGSAHGFMTCVPASSGWQGKKGRYKKSQQAGRYLHKRICKKVGARSRGVVKRSDLGGFNWCKRPAVLFEMGVQSSYHDDRLLARASYRKKMARAIADATCGWLVHAEKARKRKSVRR